MKSVEHARRGEAKEERGKEDGRRGMWEYWSCENENPPSRLWWEM